MARLYRVPVEITEAERIFGGMLTFKQFSYIAAGFALGGAVGAGAFFLLLACRFFLLGTGLAAGLALAFIKVYHTPLDVFLVRWVRWKTRGRAMYLQGDD